MIVPDFAGPIRAHRVWGVACGSHGPRLASMTAGFASRTPVWLPYRRFEAACLAARPCGEAAPTAAHTCGVHAFKSQQDARRWARAMARVRGVVVGEVHLWGVVVEGEGGYRAQFAYPAIFTSVVAGRGDRVDLDAIAAAYGLVGSPVVA